MWIGHEDKPLTPEQIAEGARRFIERVEQYECYWLEGSDRCLHCGRYVGSGKGLGERVRKPAPVRI